jgi:hypothetical protein
MVDILSRGDHFLKKVLRLNRGKITKSKFERTPKNENFNKKTKITIIFNKYCYLKKYII